MRMPLGGFCETCGRWVWVNAYGECQFGHPASVVRDVQQLKPAPSTEVVPGDEFRRQAETRRRRHWWWRHSGWILWTFTLGFLSWVGYFYIGVKARKVEWILSGFAYLIPPILTIAAIGSGYLQIAFAVQLLAGAVSVLQAFLARPQYRALMFGDAPSGTLPTPPPLRQLGGERRALPKGVDASVAELISAAHDEVDGIMVAAESIVKPDVRDRVARLCATAQRILDELRKEPRQIEMARAFLTYYLETAHRIVRGYADLSRRGVDSADVAATLARAEASLEAIQQTFDRQLASLLEHDVIDLDSEVALLEKTVQMDNLLSPVAKSAGSGATTGGTG
jgi:hypothetical protein